jgi:hypothetical protein
MPEVCPILALALFPLVQRCSPEENRLFPGANQYDRFRKSLKRISEIPQVKHFFQCYNIEPDNLGTHSLRKGAATYCSSGSSAAPPVQAINLRAGWAMCGVQDRYYRFESSGDYYVGRTVCGLPILSEQFALLCPSFRTMDIGIEASEALYPNLPEPMRAIKQYLAASFCYHAEFLEKLNSQEHPINHYLRHYGADIARWKQDIFCGYSDPDIRMVATGIPPHVSLILASQS